MKNYFISYNEKFLLFHVKRNLFCRLLLCIIRDNFTRDNAHFRAYLASLWKKGTDFFNYWNFSVFWSIISLKKLYSPRLFFLNGSNLNSSFFHAVISNIQPIFSLSTTKNKKVFLRLKLIIYIYIKWHVFYQA